MSKRADASGVTFWEDVDETEALQRFRTLVNAIDDGICQLDAEGRFVAVNDVIVETTGYARDELLGSHASILLGDEDASTVEREIERQLASDDEPNETLELAVETADGDRIPCELRVTPLVEDGGFRGTISVIRDVSDREERERPSWDRERGISTLMDNVPGMVYRCRNERDWPMEFVSDGCRELIGYEPEVLERDEISWGEDVILTDEDRERLWERVQAEASEKNTFSGTYRIETADGEVRWVRDYGRGVYDENGDLVEIEGIVSDVTERKRLETELEEILGRVSDAFYALDDRWRFTHVNERAEELIDYRDEGLVGKNFWEVFEWATGSKLGEEYRTAMETQEPTAFEFYYPEPLEAWYEIHAYPSETGLSVYFQDVTDRKQRERQLEESERRYRALVEHLPNGAVALVDEDLTYRTVGGNPLDVADVAADEIEGSPVRDALPPELADELVPRYEAALDGEANSFEAEYDGRIFEFHIVPVRDDDGDAFAALGMSWDVTERKESQRKLQRSERRYRTLVENFPNGAVALFDGNLEYTVTGGEILGDIDVSTETVVGQTVWERYPEEVATELEPKFRAALDGEISSFEFEFHDRHWLAHTLPVSDDQGDVFAGMLMVQDITEQKERERYLREAKSQLEAATEAGAVGTWEWHVPEDEFVTDETFARKFGVDPEVARDGVSLDEFVSGIHEDDRERVERKIEEAVETCGEYEAEYRVWNADDELRWVVARGHVECDEEGNPVTFPGALTDITERKRAEEELEEHRRQLETLFEVLPVGVVVADEDGTFVEANETAKEIWGGDVFDAESVADYDRYPGWWADTGEPVEPDEWTMARVLQGEEITEPDIFEIETMDGERRVIMAHGMPVRGADGDVTRGVATLTDITERREYQRQLEETVEKLEESNDRLESFASMLAHELRNPVTIGQIYSQQLPDKTDREAVEYVTEAFDRMENIIDVMLVLTRGQKAVGDSDPLSVADVVRDAWDEVDAAEATLMVEIGDVMQADETFVRHLFRNLFENAVQHGGADVTVRVDDLPSGFYVADDGVGIPPEDRDTVFEAGYTTATGEGGTGLGLAFVEKLADVYGWDCAVTESADGGAHFEFRNVDLGSTE